MLHSVDPSFLKNLVQNVGLHSNYKSRPTEPKNSTSQKCSGHERIGNTVGLAETERDIQDMATRSNSQCGILDWVSEKK